MQIPRIDLHAQYEAIKYEVATAFEEVLENMQLFLGPQLQAFEKVFAAYCGCHYGVGLSSGTDALTLAFRSCGIGPGDEVITVANAFIATVGAIALVGAKSIFVDVDQDTYSMDWRQLDQVFTPCTRALLPIDLYGHPAEMQPVLEFVRAHGLRVIEGASQAHDATYYGQRVGSFGDIGCFRLYYSKNPGPMVKQAFASLVTMPLRRTSVCCAITALAYVTDMSCWWSMRVYIERTQAGRNRA